MRIGSRIALATVLMICAGSVQAGTKDEVKAQFSKFVAAQNAHDLKAVSDLLLDSPQFLWVTRGALIWGREAAQTAQPTRFLMNQILVKTAEDWKVSSILPIPALMQ